MQPSSSTHRLARVPDPTRAADLVAIARLFDADPGRPDGPDLDEVVPAVVFGAVFSGPTVELHLTETDHHPGVILQELVAPADWQCLGVHTGGWASGVDAQVTRLRSDGERRRMRLTHLVARTGAAVDVFRDGPGEPVVHCSDATPAGDVGQIDDLCRRALGLPTAPPPPNTLEFWAARWVDEVFTQAVQGELTAASWAQVARLHNVFDVLAGTDDPELSAWVEHDLGRAGELLARAHPWARLREATIDGTRPVAGISPSFAAWMDDGMFARHVLGHFPPLEDLLPDLHDLLAADAYGRLVDTLEHWSLLASA